MKKGWFIKIGDQQYGPYTIEELKSHALITPDTLVRPDDSEEWRRIGDIEELSEVFEDAVEDVEEEFEESCPPSGEDLVATMYLRPNLWIIWAVILLLIFYVVYKL